MNAEIINDIIIKNKKTVSITGANKVKKLFPNEVLVDTVNGTIKIEGSNLELMDFNNSSTTININGEINKVEYLNVKKQEESFISKLFK